MKKLFILIAVAAGCILADASDVYAQTRRSVVTASTTVVRRTKIQKERKKIPVKWQHSVDLTYSRFIGATYTGGWRFGNFFYLGFGTGVQVNHMDAMPWDENGQYTICNFRGDVPNVEGYNTFDDIGNGFGDDSYQAGWVQVPVYVHMKFRFMKTKVSPYLSVSGGFNVYRSLSSWENEEQYDPDYGYYDSFSVGKGGIHGGGFAEAMIGVDFRLKNGSSITFGLGPIWNDTAEGYDSCVTISGYNKRVWTSKNEAYGGFRLGYSF